MTDLVRDLAQALAGHYNNKQQAIDNPVWFANIHVYQCPLPWSVFEGYGFYIEQVYDLDLSKPYRQAVIKLTPTPDDFSIRIENYAIQNPERFVGAGRDFSKLDALQASELIHLPGCAVIAERQGEGFKGASIAGKGCLITRKGRQTYLKSEFTWSLSRYRTLDQGLDPETNEVVWGSVWGHFDFAKIENYATQLAAVVPA